MHDPPHECDILLFDLAVLELPREFLVCGIVLGDHHHTGRAAIQPVDDARPHLSADAAQIGHVMEQGVDERAGRVAGSRVHDHPRGFVQHSHIRVLVQDLERQRFGGRSHRRDIRKSDCHALALSHRHVGPGLSTPDGDVAVFDELLDMRARMTVENRNEKSIESLPAGIGRNGKRERLHGLAVRGESPALHRDERGASRTRRDD